MGRDFIILVFNPGFLPEPPLPPEAREPAALVRVIDLVGAPRLELKPALFVRALADTETAAGTTIAGTGTVAAEQLLAVMVVGLNRTPQPMRAQRTVFCFIIATFRFAGFTLILVASRRQSQCRAKHGAGGIG